MMPCALTIAGSDSGGGAGVQADLKTFAALGVHGLSAFTALTAQSTVEVRGIHAVPEAFVRLQVETVLDDFGASFVKTGMLFSSAIIRVVADLVDTRGLTAVVDPVCIAESGATLLPEDALPVLIEALIPRARLVTPNLPELSALTGIQAESVDEMVDAGRALLARGAEAVLVKGGHRRGDPIDVLLTGGEVVKLGGARIDTTSTHGTGCTYAAAITAYLARGEPMGDAVRAAHGYLQAAIAAAPKHPELGRGHGPVHHFHAHWPWPRGRPLGA